MTFIHDVNVESTDGLLLIHNPTDDTLLSFGLLKAIGYKPKMLRAEMVLLPIPGRLTT